MKYALALAALLLIIVFSWTYYQQPEVVDEEVTSPMAKEPEWEEPKYPKGVELEKDKLIYDTFKQHGNKVAIQFICISRSENGSRATGAVNINKGVKDSRFLYDIGILQVNSIHWERYGGSAVPMRIPDILLTDEGNVQVAEEIYRAEGMEAWVVYKKGWHKDCYIELLEANIE